MRALGPLWGVGLIVVAHLLWLVLGANLTFTLAVALVVFRNLRLSQGTRIRRGWSWLVWCTATLGLYVLITGASLLALHAFARTPVRDVQIFEVD